MLTEHDLNILAQFTFENMVELVATVNALPNSFQNHAIQDLPLIGGEGGEALGKDDRFRFRAGEGVDFGVGKGDDGD